MDHFNKIKGHVSDLMGGSRNKPPPDDLMVSCRTQLKDLQDEIVQVKKQFTHYAHQVVEAAEASVTLSKSVGNFYSKANHPGRTESVNTYQKVQEEIANRAVNTFHITVENGLIAELAEWNGLVEKHLENIRMAEGTRTTAYDTQHRLNALRSEYQDKKNKKSKSMFGGNREQELEDLEQRIAKASDVRKSLTEEYQKQKSSIAQAVKQLMEKRYIYFDRIYVQMLECQAEYFSHAATVSKRFQRDIDYYRKQYPKTNEFQHSNGAYGGAGRTAITKSKSAPNGQTASAVEKDSGSKPNVKRHKQSRPMVDFEGTNSPPSKPALPTNPPPAAPLLNGNAMNGSTKLSGHYDALPTGSMDSSTASSAAPTPSNGQISPPPEDAATPRITAANGGGLGAIHESASVTPNAKSIADTESGSTTTSMTAPRHKDRQPSTHDLLFGDGPIETAPSGHDNKPSHDRGLSFMFEAAQENDQHHHDEHGLLQFGDPNHPDNDLLFGPATSATNGNGSSNGNNSQDAGQSSHGDIWDFPAANTASSNPAPSHLAHQSADDPFGFLSNDHQPAPRQRSQTESAAQIRSQMRNEQMKPSRSLVGQSASGQTPPNGAQEDPLSKKNRKQMANMQLSATGQKRAQRAYEKEMARREAEEKKEEEERNEREHWKDTHRARLKAWEYDTGNVRRNVRTLITKLPDVLPEELIQKTNWKPITVAKLLNPNTLRRGYFKCIRVVHPDKSSQRGDSIECQVICDHVFQALERAYKTEFKQ